MEGAMAAPNRDGVGRDAHARMRFARAIVLSLASLSVTCPASGQTQTQSSSEYQKPVSTQLNTSNRIVSLPVALKIDGTDAGEVVIRIAQDDRVSVPKAALAERLAQVLDKTARERLLQAGGATAVVPIEQIRAAGFDVMFDARSLELRFLPSSSQRAEGEISLSRSQGFRASATAARPAGVSGFVNIYAGVDHIWGDERNNDGQSSGRLDLQSALRLGSLVIENDARYEGNVDVTLCPLAAKCTYEHTAGLKRLRSTLVYDQPDDMIRVQVGDVLTSGAGLQRLPDALGVSVEKSPRKLRPGESIRPTGRSSFRLDRAGDVDVVVNGATVQRLRLRPGSYNLSDLPLTTGANEVQLVITDDTGDRRTLNFTTFFEASLLRPGFSEWAVSGGAPSFIRDNERRYRTETLFATAFYRYGLSDFATLEADVQADDQVGMGGGGVLVASPLGVWSAHLAGSSSRLGFGAAANLAWDLSGFSGVAGSYFGTRETLRLLAEYRSNDFRTPGEYLASATGILYPQFNYWLRLVGTYSIGPLGGVTATLSGRYQFSDDDRIDTSPYTIRGDRYGADVTLSAPLTPTAFGSVTLGYSNEYFQRYFTRPGTENDPELRVTARLSLRVDDKTRISATHDSLNGSSSLTAFSNGGRGLDRWETNVDAHRTGSNDNLGGSVRLLTNRADVAVAHSAVTSDQTIGKSGLDGISQRSSARVGTSIAFADGVVGIGQPIRGNAFAVVHPHDSIRDKEITVGTSEHPRARANAWGNAVVTDIPAYTPSSIPIDVDGLPLGYSLGTGAFDTFAPYRAGYALEVGSSYSVSAYGTLLDRQGKPAALLSGTASPVGEPGRQVVVFTNTAGRFGAEGLAPGPWIIELADERGPLRYRIEVPGDAKGLYRVGTLQPVGE